MPDHNKEPKYLRLGNGTLIDTNTGQIVVSTEINRAFADNPVSTQGGIRPSYVSGHRRYLDDLPLPASGSRAVAIIAAYSIFGLEASDIAHILSTSTDNVNGVLDSKEYADFVECMLQNIREHDQNKVRQLINEQALNAATKVKDLVASNDQKIALGAAKDILDRSEAISNSGGKNADNTTLTIRIIKNNKTAGDGIDVEVE